jgi:SNF2 family DNA or RNA helicase
VLKGVMLRRLKTDMVNGKPLIELPGREVETLFCEFDDDERAFYDALANKIEIAVSKFQRAGSLQANYTAILTLLLRLRQGSCVATTQEGLADVRRSACNHPGLVTRDLLKDKDALESKPADKGQADPLRDDEGDELADALAGLTVETSRKCTVCFARCVP